MISLDEIDDNEPIIEVKPLWKHTNGQWCIKKKGMSYYFGSDLEVAEKRSLIWQLTGIYARKHSLLDFAKQYLEKRGFPTHDETYIAAWTLRLFSERDKVEDVPLWFDAQESFLECCERDSRVYLGKRHPLATIVIANRKQDETKLDNLAPHHSLET